MARQSEGCVHSVLFADLSGWTSNPNDSDAEGANDSDTSKFFGA